MLINKIKEQLMAEKIRPLHLPPTSSPSQQPLLVPTSSSDGGVQHGLSVQKPQPQQVPGHHPQPQASGPSDIALHARPVSSSGQGTPFITFFLTFDCNQAVAMVVWAQTGVLPHRRL